MQRSTAIFTICSNNYLPQANVFFASVRDHLPEVDLYLGLADEPDTGSMVPAEVRVLRADALDIPDFRRFAFGYDIMEFNTAIKPFVFLKLLGRGYRQILYFDPDILIFNDLAAVFETLSQGASFVLTPHLCSPPGVEALRTERHVMQTGVFNLGFLACSEQPETESVLRWWARKLRYECLNDQASGIFVDQKFMDLVPGFTDHSRVLRDTGMNVAYWNLAQRHIERRGSGWSVDGRPLGFFHFSGFDPLQPRRLSKHVPPFPLNDALQDLLTDYAQRLLSTRRDGSFPYAYASFASGTAIPHFVREMYREHQPLWSGDPFHTYEAYLRRPSPHAARGRSGEVVTNLMERVHSRVEEARRQFDLRDGRHVSLYASWFKRWAVANGIAPPLFR